MLFLSPIIGGPELVVPSMVIISLLVKSIDLRNFIAGEVPYHSRVSGRTEYLPVGISQLASPGMYGVAPLISDGHGS